MLCCTGRWNKSCISSVGLVASNLANGTRVLASQVFVVVNNNCTENLQKNLQDETSS